MRHRFYQTDAVPTTGGMHVSPNGGAKPGEWGVRAVDIEYPSEGNWAGALADALRCADEEQILRVLIRRDRFATRDPGMLGETVWRVGS